MPRRPIGDRAMSATERSARRRAREAAERAALRQIATDTAVTTIRQAREIAERALKGETK